MSLSAAGGGGHVGLAGAAAAQQYEQKKLVTINLYYILNLPRKFCSSLSLLHRHEEDTWWKLLEVAKVMDTLCLVTHVRR